MKAEEFKGAWIAFIQNKDFRRKGESWYSAWYSKHMSWTYRVLGHARCSEKGSPLGEHLKRILGPATWRYRTEEWKVDLVFAKHASNWEIPMRWRGKTGDRMYKWSKLFWPSTYEIVVEHEDSCGISYEEMAKLILLRARLKVLITYTYDKGYRSSQSLQLIEETRKQFASMIKMAHKKLPESEETEYLLIIGRLNGKGKEATPEWYSSILSPKGELRYPEDPLPTGEMT